MILKYLKNSHSYLIVTLILFSLLFFIPSYFVLDSQNDLQLSPYFSVFIIVLSFLLTTFFSIALNNLIYEKDVIKKPNFVLAFVFLLLNTPFIINCKMILFSFINPLGKMTKPQT